MMVTRRTFLKCGLALAGASWMKGLTGQENEAALVVARPSIEVLEVWLPFLGEVRREPRTA